MGAVAVVVIAPVLAPRLRTDQPSTVLGRVEDLLEQQQSHLGRPPHINLRAGHRFLRLGQAVGLDIADEQAAMASEDRAAVSSALLQCPEEVGPGCAGTGPVFAPQFRVSEDPWSGTSP